MPKPRARRSTAAIVRELAALYGQPRLPRLTPFEFVLLENASYLVDDERRWRTFACLRDEIGLTPEAILESDRATIAAVIAGGGMRPLMRADKLLECARVAAEIGVEHLSAMVKRRDPSARRLLRRFPGIGEPAADKIMLACGGLPSIAPDSNALRVLVRLGYGVERKTYAATYRAALAATRKEVKEASEALALHSLLRKHGQEICKRSAPRCELCPLRQMCSWYAQTDVSA